MRRSGVDAGTNQFCVSSVLFMDPHQHPLIRGRLISVGVSVESWIVAPALSNAFRSSRSQHVVHGVYPWMHCIFTCIRFLRVWPNSGDICREHAISGNCVRASRCHRVAAHVAYTPKSDCVTQWRIWTARSYQYSGARPSNLVRQISKKPSTRHLLVRITQGIRLPEDAIWRRSGLLNGCCRVIAALVQKTRASQRNGLRMTVSSTVFASCGSRCRSAFSCSEVAAKFWLQTRERKPCLVTKTAK